MPRCKATMDSRDNGPILASDQLDTYSSDSQVLPMSQHQYELQQPLHIPGHRDPTLPTPTQHMAPDTARNANVFQSLPYAPYHDGLEPNFYAPSNVQHHRSSTTVGDENVPEGTIATQPTLTEQLTSDHGQLDQVPHMAEQGTLHDIRNTAAPIPAFTFQIPHPPWPQSQVHNFHYHVVAPAQFYPSQNGPAHAGHYGTGLYNAVHYSGFPTVMGPGTLAAVQPSAPYPSTSLNQGQGGDGLEPGSDGEYPDGPDGPQELRWVPNLESSSFGLQDTPFVAHSEHEVSEDVEATEGSSSGRKRRRVGNGTTRGMFGEYAVANVMATVMDEPPVDPHDVDTSGRMTHDALGDVLQTRQHGAMEIDDTNWSSAAAEDLPAGLTCVRQCEWTEQPCGLYVEMNKYVVEDHLWHWHGVLPGKETSCKFDGCSQKMKSLGRHIAVVHYDMTSKCDYCGKVFSRTDAATRHLETCRSLKSAAKLAGDTFESQPPKTIRKGYIVPAHDAT